MAVSRIKTSSVLQGFPKSRSLLAGNAAYDPAGTWLIQRITATGGETSITFSSIPQTYKHLQLRCLVKDTYVTGAGGWNNLTMRFNGDTATNYNAHIMYADGATITPTGVANSASVPYSIFEYFGNAGVYNVNILDIHDYASTTKNKTTRTFAGFDANNSPAGFISLASGAWRSTSAITSISLSGFLTACAAGSTFALYGMVG